jgi:hypothetical protein
MKAEQNYFFCYSRDLMAKLKKEGFSYICCAIHEKSNKKFWLFERVEGLHGVVSNFKG